MSEKLCVFCKNFNISTGSSDTFSESRGDLYCNYDLFDNFDPCGVFPSHDETTIRSVIHTAKTCERYDPVLS